MEVSIASHTLKFGQRNVIVTSPALGECVSVVANSSRLLSCLTYGLVDVSAILQPGLDFGPRGGILIFIFAYLASVLCSVRRRFCHYPSYRPGGAPSGLRLPKFLESNATKAGRSLGFSPAEKKTNGLVLSPVVFSCFSCLPLLPHSFGVGRRCSKTETTN